MNLRTFLLPLAAVAAAGTIVVSSATRSEETAIAQREAPSTDVCPTPCAHCAITTPVEPAPPSVDDPAEPGRRRVLPDPGVVPVEPAPGRGEPVPPTLPNPDLPPAPVALTLHGVVTLPDGSLYTARAPLPVDRQGFTWRTFENRALGKRILGLHVYAPRVEPDLVVGTVRWSNGAVRPNGTGFCGLVYYDSFTLTAPRGWEFVTLPTKGQTVRTNVWVVIAAPAEGDHVARPREMLEWPYALVPAGNVAARARALAALKYQDLVIPDPVKDYGPTEETLPKVDRAKMAAICRGWATSLLDAQARGTKIAIENIANVEAEQIGAHWMDGSSMGYAHGGFGIDPTATFVEQVPDAVLAHAILHRANVARQFCAAYDLDTGRPIALHEWSSPPSTALMSGEAGREGQVEIVQFLTGDYYTRRYPRFNTGICKYEQPRTATVNGQAVFFPGLWTYETHDVAHSVRAFRHAINLIELANDPAARDDVLLFAEFNRCGYFSNRSDERTRKKNPSDGWWPTTLVSMRETVTDKPHQGSWIDRNWAWAAFGGACAITYEPDPARVEKWKAWGGDMLSFATLASDRFGFSGRYFSAGNLPPTVSGVQTFHEMLVMTHRVTLAMALYDTVPPELAQLNRTGLTSALSALKVRQYGGSVGPPHWIGTANNNVELPALSEAFAYGEGDPAHIYAACAMTFRADPTHPEVLSLALKHWHPTVSLQAMNDFCASMVPNKAWSCAMESVLQQHLAQ